MRISLAALVLALAAPCAFAQLFGGGERNFKELDAPPPPALRTEGLVAIEVPRSSLRFGIDPASITLGDDRVVRYVAVGRSDSGVINAMYEGIHCNTGQVKVYARHGNDGGWKPVSEPEWRSIFDTKIPPHSLALARAGVCANSAPNGSPQRIVSDLRSSVDQRFGGGR